MILFKKILNLLILIFLVSGCQVFEEYFGQEEEAEDPYFPSHLTPLPDDEIPAFEESLKETYLSTPEGKCFQFGMRKLELIESDSLTWTEELRWS